MADTDPKKRFDYTVRVNDKTIDFQVPIDDPFIRTTVYVEWRLISWLPFPRIRHKVEVLVNGDTDAVNAVFTQINQLGLPEPTTVTETPETSG